MTKPLSLWRVVEALRHDFLQLLASLMSISSDMLLSFCPPGSESAAPLLLLPTNQPFHFSHHLLLYPRACSSVIPSLERLYLAAGSFSPASWHPRGSLFLKSLFEHLSLILTVQSLTSASHLSHFLTFHSCLNHNLASISTKLHYIKWPGTSPLPNPLDMFHPLSY